MFLRIKKIKGKEYAYIVKNEWKTIPKSSRQKVIGYAGRVYRFDLKNNIDFLQFMKMDNLEDYTINGNINKIITDLIEWELFKFGISRQEFSIDLNDFNNIKIQKNNRNVVFLINDGFMCNLTLKNIFYFKSEGDEQTDGYRLARAFVEAGIKVPQEIFIGIFGNVHSS